MPFGPQNPFVTMEDDDIPLDTFGMNAFFFFDKYRSPSLIVYADRELLAQLREQDRQPITTGRGGLLHRFTEECKTSRSIFYHHC